MGTTLPAASSVRAASLLDNCPPADTLLPLALAGLAAAFAWWVGHWMARSRMAEPLREARVQVQLLTQMLDVWYWQTDHEHRLTRLQPPQGAPSSAWSANSAAQFLWERFDGADLRARIEAQAPFTDVRAQQLLGGKTTHWRLRGTPRLDMQGRFNGYVGTAHALDQEEAARADQQALSSLMSLLAGPIWVLQPDPANPHARCVRHGNAAAARLSGTAPNALAGLTWEHLLHALPQELSQAVASLQPGEHRTQGPWTIRMTRAGDGSPGGDAVLLVVLHDPQAQGAVSADDPSEHESFSYTISHDLRAPIRVVDGFARILKEDYGPMLDRIGNDHVDRILGAAARMNNMVDALLALAQLSAKPLARQPVNLSQLASFIVDDLKRESPGRQVNVSIQPSLMAHGDPTLLRVALENLLGNAWKYSARRPEAHIAFERSAVEGRDVFTVRDNGAGFDMRFADRLFGVFQRLHSASEFQGTGVGLASVKRIVRRHGGDIWAESELGNGARFYFTLPCALQDGLAEGTAAS